MVKFLMKVPLKVTALLRNSNRLWSDCVSVTFMKLALET
jgi:hypothetical protein